MGHAGEFVEINRAFQRHPAGVNAENLPPPALVRDADHDFAVEPAGTAQRLVNRVRAVGGGDHHQIGALLQPVHQGEQLRDQSLLRLARHLCAFGRDGIDLVDKDDRRRGAAGLLEHFAQALFRFAIARAHDFRTVDGEELGVTFIRDGLRQPGLASARRAVEQDALGRFDTEADEQFGIAQRQLDHLAQGPDGLLHPADIIIVHHRAAVARVLELGAQFDFGVLVDMDDALGAGRGNGEADLGQGIGGRAQQLAHVGGHVLHRLLPGGGDQIARHQRTAEEVAFQGLRRPLQPHFALGGSEHHAGSRARFAAHDLDMLTRSALRIAALQTVEPHHIQRVVLRIGCHCDRGGGALAADFDHIALGNPELLERRTRHPRDPGSRFFLARWGNL